MKTLTAICFSLLIVLACASSFQDSSRAANASSDRLFDQYGAIAWEDEMARLDNFAIQLQHEPDSIGYIFLYNGKRMCPSEAQARAIRAKGYVVEHRGVEWNRVIWKVDGYMEDAMTVLQPAPRSAIIPYPFLSSTVNPNEVEIIKNCRERINRIKRTRW